MASRAEELFERIVKHPNGSEAGVRELIDTKFHEREYLDYKVARTPQGRIIDNAAVREHWSKSLSAYANTGGGVVIWGVNCKNFPHPELPRDSRGKVVELDEPDSPALHPVARDLAQLLADLKRDATDDVVENVRVETVTFGGTAEGCVVCLIPEGRNKPYRAMYADEKYWMRDIDRMTVIPHALLRSLFYPRVQPRIEVEVTGALDVGSANAVLFGVEIVNDGASTAHEILIRAQCPSGLVMVRHPEPMWDIATFQVKPPHPTKGYEFYGKRPLHPASRRNLAVLAIPNSTQLMLPGSRVSLSFEAFVRDGEPRRSAVTFGTESMMNGTPATRAGPYAATA